MKNIIQKNIIIGLCALLALLCAVFVTVQSIPVAFAEGVNFDYTDVMDDLRSSTVNGEAFDFNAFLSGEKSLTVVNFVEYCYTSNPAYQGEYGLYIYLCNTQGLTWQDDNAQNQIQMAVEYGRTEDGEIAATRFAKFRLKFCSKSTDGKFYKYKVEDRAINGTKFINRVMANARRYDVSGIELLLKGNRLATEYGVGGTWTFTGYAEGLAPDGGNENTLSCVCEDLETCELSVHTTYYRLDGVSDLGKGHYYQINSVWFNMPKRFVDKYGELQKIRAEWWEYKLNNAIVTSNDDFYNEALAYSKQHITATDGENKSIPYKLYFGHQTALGTNNTTDYYDWSFNYRQYNDSYWSLNGTIFSGCESKSMSRIMPLVFKGVFDEDNSSPFEALFKKLFYDDPVAGNVERTAVEQYLYTYTNDDYGYIDCNGRQISQVLVSGAVDYARAQNGIKPGYNDVTIDLYEDRINLKSYDDTHSGWNKFWDFFGKIKNTSQVVQDLAPIYILQASDVLGTDKQIAKRLYVNETDVDSIKASYAEGLASSAFGEDMVTVVFRYAVTDYTCNAVGRSSSNTGIASESKADTYLSTQTVFLNFDIIELTFHRDGVYTVIPAVSSPVDSIGGYDDNTGGYNWLKILLFIISILIGVFVLVLLMPIINPIISAIIKGILWLIAAPFKAIKAIVSAIAESKKNASGVSKQNQTNVQQTNKSKKHTLEDKPSKKPRKPRKKKSRKKAKMSLKSKLKSINRKETKSRKTKYKE